ncbi:MAG: hypothetical protein HYT93_03760 [Parcubacteria group bacterium]|nr:hypothetical protein [Parcubacteria group bacterium]
MKVLTPTEFFTAFTTAQISTIGAICALITILGLAWFQTKFSFGPESAVADLPADRAWIVNVPMLIASFLALVFAYLVITTISPTNDLFFKFFLLPIGVLIVVLMATFAGSLVAYDSFMVTLKYLPSPAACYALGTVYAMGVVLVPVVFYAYSKTGSLGVAAV